MENKINNASLKFTCTADWDTMKPAAEGRFCDTCQKKVYDLTDKNVAYFVSILQENDNKVCGRFNIDQLAEPARQYHRPYWRKWLIAAMVFIGFSTLAQKVKSQGIIVGKVVPKPVEEDGYLVSKLGEIALVPNPAHLKSLHAYVVKKCKVATSTNGRIIASFIVGKDGALENLAVSNHLGEKVRTEVLKILKTAPKWKHADEFYGRPYALQLTFKNGRIETYCE
uniref:hypothetical protein n=1 Tax=Pedobacter schmidteae TaxID=2201271 RepID=UPI000EAE259A|nr:hypothetical protein [Pedobacter schmidteae]